MASMKRMGMIVVFGLIFLVFFLGNYPGRAAEQTGDDEKTDDATDVAAFEPDLFAHPEQILKKMQKGDSGIQLVDVRPEGVFAEVRIPGSFNIPLFALKTKAFLKSKQVVVAGDGRSCEELQRACRELRALGFDANILFGGINHWRQAGGLVQGDYFKMEELKFVSPETFYANRFCGKWIVVDATSADSTVSVPWESYPAVSRVEFAPDSESFSKQLATAAKQQPSGFVTVLAVTDSGQTDKTLEDAVRSGSAGFRHIVYLKGGEKVYARFLDDWKRISKDGRQKRSGGWCPGCP